MNNTNIRCNYNFLQSLRVCPNLSVCLTNIESAHFSTRNLLLFHKLRKETPFQILSDNRLLSEACQAMCTRLFEYTGVESETFAVRKCAFRFFEFHPCKRWPARSSVLIETREWRFVACRANRWLAVITDRTGND